MAGEHQRRGSEAGVVAAEDRNRRLCRCDERDHRAVAGLQAGAADRVERDAGSGGERAAYRRNIAGASRFDLRATGSGRFIADVSKPRRAAMSPAAASSPADGCSGSTMRASTKSIAPSPLRSWKTDAGLEEVERARRDGTSARCCPAPDRGHTDATRKGESRRSACSHRENLSVQNKEGTALLRCPSALTGLAPPAFTAPCRNQTSEPAPI